MSVPDVNFEVLLERLLAAQRLTIAERKGVEKLQGVYVWWLFEKPDTCLKVGQATLGSRKEGLRRRIRHHFSSNEDSSVLAKHLAADKTLPCCVGVGLEGRQARKAFLATKCCFQTLAVPELTEDQLDDFEDYLEAKLKPRYIGKVGGAG